MRYLLLMLLVLPALVWADSERGGWRIVDTRIGTFIISSQSGKAYKLAVSDGDVVANPVRFAENPKVVMMDGKKHYRYYDHPVAVNDDVDVELVPAGD